MFANLISLMLSTPSQAAPLPPPPIASSNSKTPVQGTAATPAQIADAMIRSMLGRSPTTASAASDNLSSTPVVFSNGSSANEQPATADPVVAASTPDDAPVQIPLTAVNANPPAPGTTNPNQAAQAPRKQPRNVSDTLMATVTPVVTMPALPTAVTPPPADPKSNVPAPAMPLPATQDSAASFVTLPLATNSAEAKVAFTAILTPAKEAPEPTAGPATPTPEPAGAGNFSTPVALPIVPQPATAANPQPQATASPVTAGQVSTAPAGGNAQPDGDASSQQENDSPETPARPVALASATKIKPDVQQDENALTAAATLGVGHAVAVPSFTSSPTDPTRTSAPAQSDATSPAATPYNATAEALRTTESNLAAAPPLRTGAAQEISIRIAPPDSPAVDLRVVERDGQIHVDVRTPDSAMQTSLRQDLGTLTNSLERAGYHTETFTPSSTLGRAASSAQTGNQDGNQGNQQDPSQNRGGQGDFSDGRRQQQQKRSGTWLEELEEQS